MPIPRFPSVRFPGFCPFPLDKKELALEMKDFYDFPYSLLHIRSSDETCNDNKKTLRFAWNKLKFLQELLRNLQ